MVSRASSRTKHGATMRTNLTTKELIAAVVSLRAFLHNFFFRKTTKWLRSKQNIKQGMVALVLLKLVAFPKKSL